MDPQTSLYPIVCSPLTVSVGSQTYTCSGRGLEHNGHKFDNGVKGYLPLLEPKKTKAGKIAVHQPHIQKQPSQYWKAQCLFRNLNQSGTIPVLQNRLRESNSGMDGKLREIEIRMNQEFLEKNARCRDDKWATLETNEQKAEADPSRFLRETFAEDSLVDVVVLKTHGRSELHEAAKPLGLQTVSENAPLNSDGSRPSIDRWIIIGRTRSHLSKEQSKIGCEALRMKQLAAKLRTDRTERLHKEVIKKSKVTGPRGTWDVTGAWKISCPYMEEQWGDGDDECSLELYITDTTDGQQMWATFDFIVYTGVMRFVKPASESTPPALKPTSTLKRKRAESEDENDDEEEECEDGESTGSESYDDEDGESDDLGSAEFLLESGQKPSPKQAIWNFRWRGEETGEGEIALGSDDKMCEIKFGGQSGTELSGTIHTDIAGSCDFKGWKTGPLTSTPMISVGEEWERRSKRAYEFARVARWR